LELGQHIVEVIQRAGTLLGFGRHLFVEHDF
jgi:hypothetical protein